MSACRLVDWKLDSRARWDLVLLKNGRTSRASTRWLLDATGRRALIATSRGEPSLERDKLVAHCRVEEVEAADLDARTWIESVEDGWWYSALLPGRRRMLAFFTDSDLPAAGLARAPEGFSRLLGGTRQMKAWGAKKQGTRIRRFPAASLSRKAFSGNGWIALGDASLTFDPVSSQGIFHALYTGLRGAQAVAAALGGDASALSVWNERLFAIEAAYRQNLAVCYDDERRWPESVFWKRRHRELGVSPDRIKPDPPATRVAPW
jgi:flavin-dependent dehydrogenase